MRVPRDLEVVLWSFILFGIISSACADNHDGKNIKDITFARPKHLRYPSYKSLQANASSLESVERRGKHNDPLESEESQHVPTKSSGDSRKYLNDTSNEHGPQGSPSNSKRSLFPPTDPFVDGKNPRFGSPLGIQKTPPDLQFGLAFTVPFVSLSTDKLLHTFAGKSYGGGAHNDVSNILKLNIGGLIAAIIVGIGAFLLVPGLLHPGKLGSAFGGSGGWGGSLLDSILPAGLLPGFLDHFLGGHGHHGQGYGPDGDGWAPGHEDHVGNRPFGYQDFYEYNGVHNHNRKDTGSVLREKSSRREGRNINGTSSSELLSNFMTSVTSYAKKYVTTAEGCLHLQVCRKAITGKNEQHQPKNTTKEEEDSVDFVALVESISENDLVKGTPISKGIKAAHAYGRKNKECKKYEKPECK